MKELIEKSAYKELKEFIDSCSLFFNERVSTSLFRLTANAIDESIKKERDKNISKELQELEPLLLEYKANKRKSRAFQEIQLEAITKKIKELYKPIL